MQRNIQKMENYCAYQERCHEEVIAKMRSMHISSNEIDEILAHLINHNFLNEARFACSFARGKHRFKNWGKIRITNELKNRKINNLLIKNALKEISPEEYSENFDILANKKWKTITEPNILKKQKKFCDYLLRRGFENDLIFEKLNSLKNEKYTF